MMSGENKVSWNVKDLIPNGEYYFRVQAVNKIGGGEFIELRNPVIAQDQKRENSLQMCCADSDDATTSHLHYGECRNKRNEHGTKWLTCQTVPLVAACSIAHKAPPFEVLN